MELTAGNEKISERIDEDCKTGRFAIDSTPKLGATPVLMGVGINTLVSNVDELDMERKLAQSKAEITYSLRPKFLRHSIWGDDVEMKETSAEWTE
jgi:hypothetical protein